MRDNSADVVSNIGLPAGGKREKPIVAMYGNFFPITVEFIRQIRKFSIGQDIIAVLGEAKFENNAEILLSIKGICAVVQSLGSLADDLAQIKPNYHCAVGETELIEYV